MACSPLPTPPAPPALPGGISLTPTLPSPGFDATLCCKLLEITPAGSLLPLPPLIWNPAAAAALDAILAGVEAYLDALPFRCPKE